MGIVGIMPSDRFCVGCSAFRPFVIGTGKKILALCRQMKQFSPGIGAQALEISDQAPCFSEIYTWVFDLDPTQGARPLPINVALAAAIERLGLQMTLDHVQMLRDQPAA